ncbi:MAG: bifunctional DNA-formamidopyrimidine glycosylase/DNA-(apurinic or apyrimidinic site) lyase [Planctomycetes bacterium]|nr:bifunctional DNA-formamidopyrimidine glycosylase/DNA-(apurinic or apyrimidinic site) lyase [Planctomycetota bacterium]
MPELPEVETIVRQIRPGLVGRTVVGARVLWARSVARPSAARFSSGLVGRRVVELFRRGKYFVARLRDADDAESFLVGHLRMSGRLYLGAEREPPYTRVALDLDDGRTLAFSDVRKFGRLALVARPEEGMPALGPEPLDPSLDAAWMARELRRRKRALKPLLLDQSFLAGLGNIYVDESLHRAGLHPLRRSDRAATRAGALLDAIRTVLVAAIEAEGSSFDVFYRTPEGQPGAFQDEFLVYGRDGRPCRACGAPIVKIVVGQRGTHFCRRCQPAPRPRARAAAASRA